MIGELITETRMNNLEKLIVQLQLEVKKQAEKIEDLEVTLWRLHNNMVDNRE